MAWYNLRSNVEEMNTSGSSTDLNMICLKICQDFLDRLREEFGSFTKSEMRLIALLKMNLSSKDIANTLRISAEGVKKARYRLRKKMGLSREQDIQDYLLGY